MAQARRWKWNSVHLVQQNRSARQCLWALSMDSTKNNKYNKNMPPFGIWLRIRGYLADAASQINDYLARCASTRRQWADHASYYGQASDTAITFDSVYAITSALADVRRLRESRLAIQNWIMAFANSKIVMIQSAVRGWLARLRCSSRVDNGLPVLGTGPVSEGRTGPVSEVNFNTSAASVVDDAVVLTASEAVSAVTRMSGSSRQFRSAITFAVDKDWLSGWRSWITIFDTAAMINMIAERAVDSSWKYVDGNSAWSSVTSVDGVKIAVGGKVIIPGHAMVLNGRVLPMIATVVKSIPNQVELLIGLPVILSPEYNLLTDLATWRVHVRASKEILRLDLISRMIARKAFGPVNLFCLCSGMCIEIAVLIELGFDVVFVHAVEASAATREISGAAFPMIKFSNDGYVENNTVCDQECNFLLVLLVPNVFTGLSFVPNLVDTRSLARLLLPHVLIV